MELSPLENAIETMQNTYRELKTLVQEHLSNSPTALKPLSMKLNGIIDAAVMGGTAMYERAFFSEEFRQTHPEEREKLVMLENLLAEQIPLLEVGIRIHDQKKSEDLKPLHDRLQVMFIQMKEHVEDKYGVRSLGTEFRVRVGGEGRRSVGGRVGNSVGGSVGRVERAQSEGHEYRGPPAHDEDSLSMTPRSSSHSNTPGPVAKSRSNLMAKLGGVNRKKSRASEERIVNTRSGAIRSLTIPEHSDTPQYSSLSRGSPRGVGLDTREVLYTSTPRGSMLDRSSSPVASLASIGGLSSMSNRDSLVSSGSNHSEGGPAPSLPPKHGIGASGRDSQDIQGDSMC